MISGAIIAAIGVIFLKGVSKGKSEYREKHERIQRKAEERTRKIKREVEGISDDDVDKQLEDNEWFRD
ncbi:hypothetical protein [uncultured Paraglaciecola sp.]|uniref:hypothetical protein n=1 Tax=uncultured Paraglaciecola sp. TaxID=1765024 RepID=UPI002608D43E|nr:hypothetical protein [uncultured Paraglaciecola sp.]